MNRKRAAQNRMAKGADLNAPCIISLKTLRLAGVTANVESRPRRKG
jgi:hypothetical protein